MRDEEPSIGFNPIMPPSMPYQPQYHPDWTWDPSKGPTYTQTHTSESFDHPFQKDPGEKTDK